MKPVERLLAKLPDAKQAGKGWSACCPAHEDRRASLSIGEGDDSRALVKCHAGCSVDDVCAAVGLRVADLMPTADTLPVNSVNVNSIAPRPKKMGVPLTRKDKPVSETFATARDAVAELERRHGPRSALWTYHNAHGEPVGVVVRWDLPNGKKDIRPARRHGDGWRIGGMPEPRPLYNLTDLARADQVFIPEGEKAADAARAIGLTATTSAHGSQSPDKTDWSPLAGKECIILPDNDVAGRKYADAVAAILTKLTPPAVVKVLNLPDLAEKGDVADWVEAGGTEDELNRLAEAAAEWTAADAAQPWFEIIPFDGLSLQRFPTNVLPKVLRDWVEAESHATQTPADLAGLLALAVCSATIARRVVVEPRSRYREPVNLFVAILLEPGNRKSAVFADAMRPFRELEAELIESARPDIARKQSDRRQDEARLKKLEKKAADKGDAEARHEAGNLAEELAEQAEPVLPRLIVDDATSEKLGMMLAEQKGRIASMSPEGGVFDLMAGLYSKSGIPQFVVYLMGHSGDDLNTDRVSRKSVRVESPALTCAYAMQPQVIVGLAENPAFRGRGLLARFLYAAPKSWIGSREIATTPVSDEVREAYRQTVRTLADLDGEQVLYLEAEAAAAFEAWEAEIETMLHDGGEMEIMRDWGSKLAGATARMAAVMHCVEHGPVGYIGGSMIAAAIEIARYLVPHAEATFNMMQAKEASSDNDARYVLRWIKRHDHREFSKRDAHQHGKRRFPKADDIDPSLDELARRGYIRLRPSESTGPGRPSSPSYEVNPVIFANENPEKRSQYSQYPVERPQNSNIENNESALEQSENTNRVEVKI